MRLVILEAESLGKDMDLSGFSRFGEVTVYEKTTEEECPERVREADIVLCNKVRMCSRTRSGAENLKLICVTATGINNIDLDYVKRHNIAVTNVAGYSTVSVAQHTFAMYFYLAEKLRYYDDYVKNGSYAASSLFTCMDRPFTELEGKTWGIIGLGAIGRAALDVLSSEPIRSDSPLLKMADDDRLYITPHIAWASKEARTRLIGLVQKNFASYLEGGMENRVV